MNFKQSGGELRGSLREYDVRRRSAANKKPDKKQYGADKKRYSAG